MARPSKKVFLQILWSGTDHSIPSLYLFTDTKRYLFNCGASAQRLFNSNRLSMARLDTFLLTHCDWTHMAGLPGFGMTLRDIKVSRKVAEDEKIAAKDATVKIEPVSKKAKKPPVAEISKEPMAKAGRIIKAKPLPDITVRAPSHMHDIISGTRHFMRFDDSAVNFRIDDRHQRSFVDNEVDIFPVLVNTESKSTSTMSYLCQLKPILGKFLEHKAKAFGIPKGPLRGQLHKGIPVTLDNGKTISPDDVREPSVEGTVFFVLDCPSALHVRSLREHIEAYIAERNEPHLVVHVTQKDVVHTDEYQQFVDRFPSHTKQLFLCDCQPSLRSVFMPQYAMQLKLNKIHPGFFPLIESKLQQDFSPPIGFHNFSKIHLREIINDVGDLVFDNSQCYLNPNEVALRKYADVIKELRENLNLNQTEWIENLNINNLEKSTGSFGDNVNNSKSLVKNERKTLDNTVIERKPDEENMHTKSNHLETSSASVQEKASTPEDERPANTMDDGSFPKVVFLGTGSALPLKLRNVSSTLVFFSEDEAVLFDCGEDCYGQILRHYGDNKTREIISKIKHILISHMHADHHLGLITMMQKIKKLRDDEVILIGPQLIKDWLDSYKSTLLQGVQFTANETLVKDASMFSNVKVRTVKVDHPGCAYGFVVECNARKITFSGDARPSKELAAVGHGSDILIHEATMENEKQDEAVKRKHSTIGEAFSVCEQMQAKQLMLTHFSQRYPKLPNMQSQQNDVPFVLAFDHMEVEFSRTREFSAILPQLTKLFSATDDTNS